MTTDEPAVEVPERPEPRPVRGPPDLTGPQGRAPAQPVPLGGGSAGLAPRDRDRAADVPGFAGLALMDHLIQIPQVDRAWSPIPEPWVTLGAHRRAGHGPRARHPGHADHLPRAGHHRQGRGHPGRADRRARLRRRGCGLVGARARRLRAAVPARRGSGWTRSRRGSRRCARSGRRAPRRTTGTRCRLPETTCYPRPVGPDPGHRRGQRRADPAHRGQARRRRQRAVGPAASRRAASRTACARYSETVRITVLDLPTVGRDREDTWARVERLRGTHPAAAYAERTHAGTGAQQRDRYGAAGRRAASTRCSSALRRPRRPRRTSTGSRRPARSSYLSSALESPRTRRATISCWICWVPSKMSRILESRAHFSSSSLSL